MFDNIQWSLWSDDSSGTMYENKYLDILILRKKHIVGI